MKIRKLEPGDFDEWLRMRLALCPELSAEIHRSEMQAIMVDPTCQTFVAVRPDGSLGGFLEFDQRKYADNCRTSPVGYIEGWYVDINLQRRGVGKELVEEAESWASKQGLHEMASDCMLDNEVSLKAHLALGYEQGDRLIHFRKKLND
jgi:aminoglycoside 6'-N-acetyltransferase I